MAERGGLPAIIAFGPRQWEGMWTGRQHLLHGLGRRGWPVVYSAGVLSTWSRESASWRAAGWRDTVEDRDDIMVAHPGRLGVTWQGSPRWCGRSIRRHARRLGQAEWLAALDKALASGGVGSVTRRRARAAEGTWGKRVTQLEGWLREACIPSVGGRAPMAATAAGGQAG